ncbi:MAG: response regulator transcription factor [Actinomycetota bacterium]|nr:response regulator transcription factor [Actinomycetota bacterium]
MPYTVLTVDDDPIMLQVLHILIGLTDELMLEAETRNGQEAVERVTSHCPHAIICDVQMPVMNGLQALPLLRSACPETVIAIYSSEPDRQTASQLGADAVFDKATDNPSEVLDHIVKLCQARLGGGTVEGHGVCPS